jgi:hypothetical protein
LKPSTKSAIRRPVVEVALGKARRDHDRRSPLAVALPEDIEQLVFGHHDEFHNADLPLSPQAGRGGLIPLLFLCSAEKFRC